ncbi:MAG: tryptophan--tRNA ligase [Ignavibacteriaceae bacterium]|jgi:tryptophanyl-tRNA synthetase|nr:MAG: tryptophan--tRNA ligase [Chlorobiota bacterium]KXK03116.1 MAG: tryptophanyl-tRNA synthetase [Chlorobi bacterium OLB4]MBV6397856.1 Tryptophan--tRNA ligase [Ignavibacteria bacterium]MCC6886890.1 tryptophan--tRNA ligase [Ignavibacteriales bacterium]MCE7953978.1 tryptophan--tRNA ligase [Chlorobi bacterium CHB7]MDL1887878.1 tryptophan--tRNA ligase [Ignavibacteria bacterium CHB1]MEB2330335.1 tryptophan--tRNA ligase [Ignavibacteriaceae bacterium]OQY76779.1 MAG: tryptophan--tRNA ligase [Igna
MIRVVSGIKPSGDLTIGNYLGAMIRWHEAQYEKDCFYFVANLHALTTRNNPVDLRNRTYDIVAWLLTLNVDPSKSTIFVQSQVKAHSEIAWILNNYTMLGELNKMTQFKDKSSKAGKDGQNAGLYNYPVLMAGDVLLYDADEVPVGDDQVQHLELARNIVVRFNSIYGKTFKEPKPTLSVTAKRVMSLNNPSSKMSKSESNDSFVLLRDSREAIIKKFKRAVTDSMNRVKFTPEQPAVSNLLTIYSGFTGIPVNEIEAKYENSGYGAFKTDLGEIVAEKLGELQLTFNNVRADVDKLDLILNEGAEKASEIADKKLSEVKNKLGLL